MTEIWKDIKGYEGLYQISNLGRLKSMSKTWVCGEHGSVRVKGETIMKWGIADYYITVLTYKNFKKTIYLHKVLAEAFLPNPENKTYINHINGNKHDNRLENLEWCTSSENQIHAYKMGLKRLMAGSKHHAAKPVMITFLNEIRTIICPTITKAIEVAKIGSTSIHGNLSGKVKSRKYKAEYL